ncbi:hypothetical protein C8R44DRAFT_871481 [Mycena epipterygia]|nr:hypothetical protein C8R44DRAFT_871481 [Mycena epipterygia]
MFFSRVIYTVAAALALVALAEARCGALQNSGLPDDCPDNSCGELAFGCFACDSENC